MNFFYLCLMAPEIWNLAAFPRFLQSNHLHEARVHRADFIKWKGKSGGLDHNHATNVECPCLQRLNHSHLMSSFLAMVLDPFPILHQILNKEAS